MQNDFWPCLPLRHRSAPLISFLWHEGNTRIWMYNWNKREETVIGFSSVFLQFCIHLYQPYGPPVSSHLGHKGGEKHYFIHKWPMSWMDPWVGINEIMQTSDTSLRMIQMVHLFTSQFFAVVHCTPKKSVVRLRWVFSDILSNGTVLKKIPTLHRHFDKRGWGETITFVHSKSSMGRKKKKRGKKV